MDDLVAFLRARYDEDERTARAVMWDGSGNRPSWDLPASATVEVGEDEFYAGDRTVAEHIARHDPARVLREIQAKRHLLDDLLAETHKVVDDCWYTCAAATDDRDGGESCDDTRAGGPCDCGRDARVRGRLALLAAVHADHPDHREAWRP